MRIHVRTRPPSAVLLALAVSAAATHAGAQAPSPPAEAPQSAEPDAKAQCAAAFEQAQTDKLAGRYISAKNAALACSQLQCGALLVRECVQLYDSLERDIPTIVVSALKAEGGELTDVRVEMDGAVVAEQMTGRPFPVDPGPHQFVFTHPVRGRVELTISARVGDRARVVEATFKDPNAKPAPVAPVLAPPPVKPVETKKGGPIPVMSYVLGGIGLAGLGGFTILRLSAASEYNDYASTCSPACNPEDVDALDTKYTLSYVSLGVGVAGIAGAAIVFAVAGGSDDAPEVQASVAPRPDGALVGVKTRF